ncbi:hypothetical protein PC116_g8863 [Phytophthora cactorum]|nr:hypothetical protein PC114_g6261 [Phytophthora cactorum]KAG3032476.1 hypothetical protein PC119_g5662 [Phytophthora cactorum]KAG4243296.1 hypothetical protein PC116_g8863 [Phytophthora cactorum]
MLGGVTRAAGIDRPAGIEDGRCLSCKADGRKCRLDNGGNGNACFFTPRLIVATFVTARLLATLVIVTAVAATTTTVVSASTTFMPRSASTT